MRLRFFCCFMRGQKQGKTRKKPHYRQADRAKIRKIVKKAQSQASRRGENKKNSGKSPDAGKQAGQKQEK